MSIPLAITTIANAYGIGREHMHRIKRRHAMTKDQLTNPDTVFEKLLEGRKCLLRSRLVDPAIRGSVREEIELAAIRGPVPSAESKISSIQ